MTAKLLIKRSDVPGKVPAPEQLALGELALNTRDGKLFLKRDNGDGSVTMVEIAAPAAIATSLGLGAFAYGAVGDWTVAVDETAGALLFQHAGLTKMRLDPNGTLTVAGDVTAFGDL